MSKGTYTLILSAYGRIVKMPSFATHIQINKLLGNGNGQTSGNGANGNGNGGKKETTLDRLDVKVEVLSRHLDKRLNEISGQDTTQSLSSLNAQVDKTKDDIFAGQGDILQGIDDSSDELAQKLEGVGQGLSGDITGLNVDIGNKLSDIKNYIVENGRKVIELKDTIEPILTDLSNKLF